MEASNVTAADATVLFMDAATACRSLAALAYHLPSEWYDFLNISSACFVLGSTDLALYNARRAIALLRNPQTLLNLAVILESQSKFYTAFSLAEEAFALAPDDNFCAILYSDALFRMGRYAEAWPIYARSHNNVISAMSGRLAEWDGESSLSGKRVLVVGAEGYGDTIFHLRWLPQLKALGADVTLRCPASLHSLLQGTLGIDRFLADSDNFLDFDCYLSLLSLGGRFPGALPSAPYLTAAARPRSAAPLIGLCTSAGEKKVPRRNRSLNMAQVSRLHRALKKYRWISLNFGDLPEDTDWAATASTVAALDILITVDTGVAHLAGALGVPCWVILPGNSALYYGIDGNRSSFYPSQRLFRNGGEGIDVAVRAVCDALEAR